MMQANRFRLLVILAALALSGCNSEELESLRKENAALKAEISALKETAEYHYRSGQDDLRARNFASAIQAFETVISKYPTDALVPSAKESLAKAQGELQEERRRQAEEDRLAKAAAEKEAAESGEEIEYATFYAKSKTGLIVGKRYRFDACLSSDASCLDARSEYVNQMICGIAPQFDDSSEYEWVLSEGRRYCGTIVASMLHGGVVGVHRLH